MQTARGLRVRGFSRARAVGLVWWIRVCAGMELRYLLSDPKVFFCGGYPCRLICFDTKQNTIGGEACSEATVALHSAGMTKAAAKELAYLGVRVNAIQPGLIRSAMTEAMPPRIWDSKVGEVPMGRAGEPDEVARVALFLASDLSSYMTGTVMEVTGGRHL